MIRLSASTRRRPHGTPAIPTRKADALLTENGFSLVELMIVVALMLVVGGMAVPALMKAVHTARLRGAGNDLSGLLQAARIRAVQDDRYYSVYFITASGALQEFVDIYPQNINGVSGSGGTTQDPKDPSIVLSSEINPQPQSAAPNTTNLTQQLLPTNPNNLQPTDASVSTTPFTFGPEGLPCVPLAIGGGTVCNSKGGSVAYWEFFQNNVTQVWEATTVTAAGRIQQWYYSNPSGTWAKVF